MCLFRFTVDAVEIYHSLLTTAYSLLHFPVQLLWYYVVQPAYVQHRYTVVRVVTHEHRACLLMSRTLKASMFHLELTRCGEYRGLPTSSFFSMYTVKAMDEKGKDR